MEHSIYTYCYKRYGETGGGWGYYSYSDGMKRLFDHSNVLREFAGAAGYELAKNRDTWLTMQMTDYEKDIENERILIERYQPEKFAYQKIEIDGKETAVFTYARNLGREIIAENRAANKLVYTLAGDSSEVQDYPCFYYGNPYFQTLTRAYFKESDQTSCATPLQSVEIKNYKSITKETVHNFLSAEPERPDVLVNLFYTLIQEHSVGNDRLLYVIRKIIFRCGLLLLFYCSQRKLQRRFSFQPTNFLEARLVQSKFLKLFIWLEYIHLL